MSNVTVSFELPEPMGKELQLAAVLNAAVLHFTQEATPGLALPPDAVGRVMDWMHAKWSPPPTHDRQGEA